MNILNRFKARFPVRKGRGYHVLVVVAFFSFAFYLNFPIHYNDFDIPLFHPIEDASLADMYKPILVKGSQYGDPVKLYYRASKDPAGNLYIAYHFFWEKEENLASGFMPFLSRWLYTGGLSIQKFMFGPADIEAVFLTISPDGKPLTVEYETAGNYKDTNFSVEHRKALRVAPLPKTLIFKTISWNHLFVLEDKPLSEKLLNLPVEYFTQNLWEKYSMVKKTEKRIRRSRAHKEYEREFVR